jgi:Zn-dependent peptidase ImmA (M78 family)
MRWKVLPTKELLEKLVKEYALSELSLYFEVSNKAIEKKCKELGVQLPTRGYWHRVEQKELKDERLTRLLLSKEHKDSPE